MKSQSILFAVLSVGLLHGAWAGPIAASKAWVRPTMPGQTVAAAYMEITAQESASLIGVRSPISPKVEIHFMQMDGDIMRMRELKKLDLPKNTAVSLSPGGYHLMLTRLKKPIQAGDVLPLTLVIQTQKRRELVTINAVAQASTPEEAPGAHEHHHH